MGIFIDVTPILPMSNAISFAPPLANFLSSGPPACGVKGPYDECATTINVVGLPQDTQICAGLGMSASFLGGFDYATSSWCVNATAGLNAKLEADPAAIIQGDPSFLSWTTNAGDQISLAQVSIRDEHSNSVCGVPGAPVPPCSQHFPVYPMSCTKYILAVNGTSHGVQDFFPSPSSPSQMAPATANVCVYQPPTISVLYNASPISEGECATITDTPSMPTLAAKLVPDPLEPVLLDYVAWWIQISYRAPDGAQYNNDLFPNPPRWMSGMETWNITSDFGSVIEGGTATIHYKYGNRPEHQFSFCINGQPPDSETVKNEILTAPPTNFPWFTLNVASFESDYRQFFRNDTVIQGQSFSALSPYFGKPHGFGIFQIDPPTTTGDIWNWTTNVAEGKYQLIYDKGVAASQVWNNYVKAFNDWNHDHPDQQASLPPDDDQGKCFFSYNPTPSQKSFLDAIWIKRNNGIGQHKLDYIYWSTSDPTHPKWDFQRTEYIASIDMDVNYVNVVCNKNP
ncbi:MAG: hypothetical protein ACHQWV_04515 [Nitrospirales bacterium]